MEVAGWENHKCFLLESLGQLNRNSLIPEPNSQNEWARPASQVSKVPPQGSWPSQKRKLCSYPSRPSWCANFWDFYYSSLNWDSNVSTSAFKKISGDFCSCKCWRQSFSLIFFSSSGWLLVSSGPCNRCSGVFFPPTFNLLILKSLSFIIWLFNTERDSSQ